MEFNALPTILNYLFFKILSFGTDPVLKKIYQYNLNNMKTKTLILSIFTLILFTGLKSQTLPVNGHFVNGNNEKIKADYVLSCEGKVIDTGKSLEDLRLDLTVNKIYVLKVTNDNFKSKTICFSVNPQMDNKEYMFEFEVRLNEKIAPQNLSMSVSQL